MMLSLLLTVQLAWSQEPGLPEGAPDAPAPPPEEPAPDGMPPVGEPIPLPPPVPSDSVIESWEASRTRVTRGRFGLRPDVGLALMPADSPRARHDRTLAGARLGGTLLHHWWTVPPTGVVWSGETALWGNGLAGRVRGWETGLHHLAGPWLGPVSLRVGPVLRGDALRTAPASDATEAELDPAFSLGGRFAATLDLPYLTAWATITPSWAIASDRLDAWDGLTDLTVSGGLAGRFRVGGEDSPLQLQLGADAASRFTGIGTLVDIRLLLHLSAGTF